MEKRAFTTEYFVYKNTEIPEEYLLLCNKAEEALQGAYSIYSGFSVGAAVLLENGEIITGSNQENAAYPSGLCAERTALFYASSRYPSTPIKTLAIVAKNKEKERVNFISPCGACRQVMAEFIAKHGDFTVLLIGKESSITINASALLPLTFELDK